MGPKTVSSSRLQGRARETAGTDGAGRVVVTAGGDLRAGGADGSSPPPPVGASQALAGHPGGVGPRTWSCTCPLLPAPPPAVGAPTLRSGVIRSCTGA